VLNRRIINSVVQGSEICTYPRVTVLNAVNLTMILIVNNDFISLFNSYRIGKSVAEIAYEFTSVCFVYVLIFVVFVL